MSGRTILVVALALVFGASAAIGINSLRNQEPAAPAPADVVSVVVAAVDVPRGTTVLSEFLKTKDYPKDLVPPGSFTDEAQIVDRVATVPIVKEEPLLEAKLAPRGSGRGAAAILPKNMRIVTIQTPTIASGVAGFVLPGDHVDVLLTVNGQGPNDPTGGGTTVRLLQNVEVFAVDQNSVVPAENKVDAKEMRSVTLLVTPDQDAMLALAQTRGTLHLSLRNALDEQIADSRPVTLADLQLVKEKPKEAPPAEKAPSVVVPAVDTTPKAPPQPGRIEIVRGRYAGGPVYVHPE